MAASTLKQDPNTSKVKKNAIFFLRTKHDMQRKSEMYDTYLLLVELFCYVVLVSSAWRNVGIACK